MYTVRSGRLGPDGHVRGREEEADDPLGPRLWRLGCRHHPLRSEARQTGPIGPLRTSHTPCRLTHSRAHTCAAAAGATLVFDVELLEISDQPPRVGSDL